MSRHPRRKLITYIIGIAAAGAVVVWGWLALADPGTRIDWQLPGVSESQVVADVEIQSTVVDSWSRYLVVLVESGSTAEDLTREMRAALDEAGWETRPVRNEPGAVEADSGSKHATFGPATRRPLYVPGRVVKLIKTTEGATSRKVTVSMSEY